MPDARFTKLLATRGNGDLCKDLAKAAQSCMDRGFQEEMEGIADSWTGRDLAVCVLHHWRNGHERFLKAAYKMGRFNATMKKSDYCVNLEPPHK